MYQVNRGRLSSNAGIAIGPILFIIAILAILAAAIAAGSGSFTSGTGSESNRTKSSALIQIGENLKIGMDRITMEGGLDPTAVNTDVTATNLTNDLFSPTGGGIAPPSVGMANNPALDKWAFPQGTIAGLGTGAANVFAVLSVSKGVCAEINNRVLGAAVIPADVDLGTFQGTSGVSGASWPSSSTTWKTVTDAAATASSLVGVATGCVANSNSSAVDAAAGPATSKYFYYQVLAIQ